MKGSYRVIVSNSRVRYDFVIRRNITIIKGEYPGPLLHKRVLFQGGCLAALQFQDKWYQAETFLLPSPINSSLLILK